MGTNDAGATMPPRLCLPVTASDLAAINAATGAAMTPYEVVVETSETGQAYVCVEGDADYRTVIFAADNRHRMWGALDWRGELLVAGPSIRDMVETHGAMLFA